MKIIKNLLAAASVLIITSTSAFSATADGTWSFNIKTLRGPCFAKPSTVSIDNGQIKGTITGVNKDFKLSGKVKQNGSFKGKIHGAFIRFEGQITGNSGSGTWKGLPACKGTLQVRKRS